MKNVRNVWCRVKADSEVCCKCWVSAWRTCGGHTHTRGVYFYPEVWRQVVVPKRRVCLSLCCWARWRDRIQLCEVNVEGREQCSHCCCFSFANCETEELLDVLQIWWHCCWRRCVYLLCCDGSGLRAGGTKNVFLYWEDKFNTPDLFRVKLILSKPWRGTAVAQWLRCCATNRKVAGSIPSWCQWEFFSLI